MGEVTNTVFGKFSETNGIVVAPASYERGKKTATGHRAHWRLLSNGRDEQAVMEIRMLQRR